MNPTDVIKQVRDHINQAKLEKALEHLLSYLEQAPLPAASWTDKVRALLRQKKKVKQDALQHIISYEKSQLTSNQITNALLQILNAIEAGETAVEDNALTTKTSASTQSRSMPWMAIGIVVAILLAVAAIYMIGVDRGGADVPPIDIKPNPDGQQGVSHPGKLKQACPPFSPTSEFNIMVLPYKPLAGAAEDIGAGLSYKLSQTMEDYKIEGDVKIKDISFDNNVYPLSAAQAVPYADSCNAELIIWGFTEQRGGQLTTITNFRFTNEEYFRLAGLDLNPAAEVDTITSISSIATTQQLTETIEESLMLIMALVARETGNHEIASNLLKEEVEKRGGAAQVPGWGTIQADEYARIGEEEQALAIYREILEEHPQNTQALTQKGILEYKMGKYTNAVASLSPVLELEPENEEARLARAAAYTKSNDLFQAGKDIQVVKKGSTDKRVDMIEKEYNFRHKKEEVRKSKAEEMLKENPSDTSALRVQAQTARNLGEFNIANMAASKLLRQDPKNEAALTTLIEIKPLVEDSLAIQKIINGAKLNVPTSGIRLIDPNIIRNTKGGN